MNTKNTVLVGILAMGTIFNLNAGAEDMNMETSMEGEAVVSAAEPQAFIFEKAPEAKEVKDTSVALTWDSLDDAFGYIISYGETSVEKSEGEVDFYDSESEDLIETNEFTVENLNPDTTYYFAVTAVDKNGEETGYSPELEVKTLAANTAEETAINPEGTNEVAAETTVSSLAIESVVPTYNNEIKVTFNKELDSKEDAVREFKIVNKASNEEIAVSGVSLEENGKTLDIMLAGELATTTEYEMTVIALSAADGTNIEAGVEGVRSFTTGEVFMIPEQVETPEVDLNAASSEEKEISAATSEEASEEAVTTSVEPEKTTEEVAADADKLPQTGTQEVVILLIALMLGGLVFIRKKLK